MFKSNLNLNYISKILFKIFKRLHRLKLNSKNLFIIFKFFSLWNSKKEISYLEKYLKILEYKKYYFLILFSMSLKFLKNHLNLKKIENNINSNKFKYSLNQKDNVFFIYLDSFQGQGNVFNNISSDFFLKLKKKIIYLEEEYKFRIDVFSFLFYGKYMEYIRKSIYNEYLTFTKNLLDYPLLKTFFRLINYTRLSKLRSQDLEFSTYRAILKKYLIYDDFNSIRTPKLQAFLSNYQSSVYLIHNLINSNFFKFLIIWKNKKFYNYLDYIWNRFIKSNFILPAYYINLNYQEEDDFTDTNKLTMMGVYSLYWQMNRYGFNFNYYYYLNSLILSLGNNKLNHIVCYNKFYLKFLLEDTQSNYWIFWYKLMKLILLDYIYKTFFKFHKSNQLNLRKKKLKFKRLLSFKLLMQTYSFIFLPLNVEFYNDDNFLNKKLETSKIYLESVLVNIFFGYNFNFSGSLNFNIVNISSKIRLDSILSSNFDYYLNLYFFFISKKIGKYFFTNFLAQYRGVDLFLKKILDSLVSSPASSDSNKLKSLRYLDFSLSKHIGINYFFFFRSRFLEEYLWDFEFVMIYSFYLIILYKYNQLYLKIFIGKFLLFGSK